MKGQTGCAMTIEYIPKRKYKRKPKPLTQKNIEMLKRVNKWANTSSN